MKELGPYQPKPFDLNLSSKHGKRYLNSEFWFKKVKWLCCSEISKSLCCLPLLRLIFSPDSNIWTRDGFKDLSHLSQAIKAHEKSPIT